jgi:hypothetical protein
MWTDLWPLAFMLGLFAVIYGISRLLSALGINPTETGRSKAAGAPPERPRGGFDPGSKHSDEFVIARRRA